MQIKQPVQFLQGFGIAAGLFLALGAVSLYFRSSPAGLAEAAAHPPEPAAAGEVFERQPAPLPPDYLDICRAAGL